MIYIYRERGAEREKISIVTNIAQDGETGGVEKEVEEREEEGKRGVIRERGGEGGRRREEGGGRKEEGGRSDGEAKRVGAEGEGRGGRG